MTWKDEFADKAGAALDHELVTNVREEFEFNMSNCGVDIAEGLPAYGLEKVMRTVAIVASARALGIDPDALRLTREEANAEILARAAAFGDRAIFIDPTTTTAADAADEIRRRLDADQA